MRNTTLAWLQELATKDLIKPNGYQRFCTYPSEGDESIALTPSMPRKRIAQIIARSGKGLEASITRQTYLREVAKVALKKGRVPSNPSYVAEGYLAGPDQVIPTAITGCWQLEASKELAHIEEVVLDAFTHYLGWSVPTACTITDGDHPQKQTPFEALDLMRQRVENSPLSRVKADKESALELLDDIDESVHTVYALWKGSKV